MVYWSWKNGEALMSRGKASGISLTKSDARIVLAMENRGDRNHDIAAWFGVNQGRIAEVKAGDFGNLEMATVDLLPPQGPPGLKGRRLRARVQAAIEALEGSEPEKALAALKEGCAKYDANEA